MRESDCCVVVGAASSCEICILSFLARRLRRKRKSPTSPKSANTPTIAPEIAGIKPFMLGGEFDRLGWLPGDPTAAGIELCGLGSHSGPPTIEESRVEVDIVEEVKVDVRLPEDKVELEEVVIEANALDVGVARSKVAPLI